MNDYDKIIEFNKSRTSLIIEGGDLNLLREEEQAFKKESTVEYILNTIKEKNLSTVYNKEDLLRQLDEQERLEEKGKAVEETAVDTNTILEFQEKSLALTAILCNLFKEDQNLIINQLNKYFEIIDQMLKEQQTVDNYNDPKYQIYNAISLTLLGTLCLLIPSNKELLEKSLPFLLNCAKFKNSQTQSLILSILSSEIINQPKLLSNYIKDLLLFSKEYSSSCFSIISSLYQYNSKDFEENLNVLIDSFKDSDNKIGILSIISEIAKCKPSLIIPFINGELRDAAFQFNSLISQFSSLLKSVAIRYPWSISPLVEDIIKTLDTVPNTRYSLPEVLGMCGQDKSKVAFDYLFKLLLQEDNNSPPDYNIIVSTLRGIRNIEKSNPSLMTQSNLNILTKLQSNEKNGGNESISSIIQNIVEDFNLFKTTSKSNSNNIVFIQLPAPEQLQSLIERSETIPPHSFDLPELFVEFLNLFNLPSSSRLVNDDKVLQLHFQISAAKFQLSLSLEDQSQTHLVTGFLKLNQYMSQLNLPIFINNDQKLLINSIVTDNSNNQFLSEKEIKDINSQLSKLFNGPIINYELSENNNQFDSNHLSPPNNNNSSQPQISIISLNDDTPTGGVVKIPSSITQSSISSGDNIKFEGILSKRTKYLGRKSTQLFSMSDTDIIGMPLREIDDSLSVNTTNTTNTTTTATSMASTKKDNRLKKIIKSTTTGDNKKTVIRLRDITEVVEADPKKKANSFVLCTKRRKYLLTAPNINQQRDWIERIQFSIEKYQQQHQNTLSIPESGVSPRSLSDDEGSSSTATSPSSASTPVSPNLKSTKPPSGVRKLKLTISQYINYKKKEPSQK